MEDKDNKIDKVLQKYSNEGFGKNAYGWYFNPWIDEYDENYDPHNDPSYNDELNKKQEDKEENPYKNMSLEELKEELAKVNAEQDDLYYYGAHQLNGLEDAGGDKWADLNKKEKQIKEQIKDRENKAKEEANKEPKKEPQKKPKVEEKKVDNGSNNSKGENGTSQNNNPHSSSEDDKKKKDLEEKARREEKNKNLFRDKLKNMDKLTEAGQRNLLIETLRITRHFILFEYLKLILPEEQCKKIEEDIVKGLRDTITSNEGKMTEEEIDRAIKELVAKKEFIIVRDKNGKYALTDEFGLDGKNNYEIDISKLDPQKTRGVAYKTLQTDRKLSYNDENNRKYVKEISKIACESIEQIQKREDAKVETPTTRKVKTLTEQIQEHNDGQSTGVKGQFTGIAGTPVKVEVKEVNDTKPEDKSKDNPVQSPVSTQSHTSEHVPDPEQIPENQGQDLENEEVVEPISMIEVKPEGVIIEGINYGFSQINDIIMPTQVLTQNNLMNKIEYLRKYGDERIVAALENSYLDEYEREGLTEVELKIADKRFTDAINNYCNLIQNPQQNENNDLKITYNLKLKLKDYFRRDKLEFRRLKEDAYFAKDYASIKAGPFTKIQFKIKELIDRSRQRKMPQTEIKQMPVSNPQEDPHQRYVEDLQAQTQIEDIEPGVINRDMLRNGQYDHNNIQYVEKNGNNGGR